MSDLIERQAAIDALKEHRSLYCDNTPNTFSKLSYAEKSRVDELDTAIATLVNLPSAQTEQKKGHYIGEADGYADGELVYDIWSCSECGCYFEDWDEQPTYNFCPNCGADMRCGENERN